jgi:DNA-binding LytR/AlgR family response regulator
MIPKLIICDDDPEMARMLVNYCQAIEGFEVLSAVNSPGELLSIMKKEDIAIVLLDIVMPEINGIEVARRLREFNPYIKIIFITGHNDYYSEAFQVYAYDYINKSSIALRLPRTLQRIKDEFTAKRGNKAGRWLRITVDKKHLYIEPGKIIYIESEGRKLKIYTKNNEYVCYGKIKDWDKRLGSTFYSCHRSYLINIKEIREIRGNTSNSVLIMSNNKKIPVSRSRCSALKEIINL